MNLTPLFEKQRQHDQYIIEKKGLEGQELLPNKILALQVELGELANEWRGFKHWSDSQEPKYGYEPLIECDKCGGKGFWFSGERIHCQKCKQTGKVTNPLLEEYVDCLHFILSIGVDSGFDDDELEYVHEGNILVYKNLSGILEQLNDLFQSINEYRQSLNDSERYQDVVMTFISLGEMLGFSWEQIEEAYNEKWEENIRRQNAGY
ncbi:dUTP diphosphatase [Brevibacillus porteri]|uniref:dUTP diphosphatase n=1 Tax=Brevibacillus porteri TaxID=2126350 RepID=UPI003D216DD0